MVVVIFVGDFVVIVVKVWVLVTTNKVVDCVVRSCDNCKFVVVIWLLVVVDSAVILLPTNASVEVGAVIVSVVD